MSFQEKDNLSEMSYTDFFSNRVNDLKPSAIRRFFDLANEMKGKVISLSIGEPDFVTPWGIRQAAIRSINAGHTHYSPNQGYIELREAIARYLKRRFDLNYIGKTELLISVGGSEAIDLCCRALINPGDEVIIPEPAFVAYQACVKLAGGIPVPVVCKAENKFKLLPEELDAVITPKTKLVILAFPNNPTGANLTKAEMEALAEVICCHNLLLLSDELYTELSYKTEALSSFASMDGMKERTIVVGGFSKAFAMTGWRLGYAAGPAAIIEQMNKIHQYAIMSSPSVAQFAAIEAVDHAEIYVKPMLEEYTARRNYIYQAVLAAGLTCIEPEGAFYIFPDIRSTTLNSNDFAEKLLLEEQVAIVPGSAFGESGEGYVRISYAASIEKIKEAMKRLNRFCQRYQK